MKTEGEKCWMVVDMWRFPPRFGPSLNAALIPYLRQNIARGVSVTLERMGSNIPSELNRVLW